MTTFKGEGSQALERDLSGNKTDQRLRGDFHLKEVKNKFTVKSFLKCYLKDEEDKGPGSGKEGLSKGDLTWPFG